MHGVSYPIWCTTCSTMHHMTTTPQFLTVPEVAAQLRVDPVTVRRWISAGRLPAFRVGRGGYRIKVADVEALIGAAPAS